MNHKYEKLKLPNNIKYHSAKSAEDLYSGFVDIDKRLVKLIKLLWKKGFITNGCCEGGHENLEDHENSDGYISFSTYTEGKNLFDLVRKAHDFDSDLTWFQFHLSPTGGISFWSEDDNQRAINLIYKYLKSSKVESKLKNMWRVSP